MKVEISNLNLINLMCFMGSTDCLTSYNREGNNSSLWDLSFQSLLEQIKLMGCVPLTSVLVIICSVI